MSFNSSKSSNRMSGISIRRRVSGISADINVTPLIDVMLVLLVIFMLTSPMMLSGIKVDLPKTQTAPISESIEPLVITINKKGYIYLQDEIIEKKHLELKLKSILEAKADTRVYVRGDKNVTYGQVVQLFGMVKKSGLTNIALVTEIDISKNDK